MAAINPSTTIDQPLMVVGIIGSVNHLYSKQWVCKQIISNAIATSLTDDLQSLHDPYHWMRSFRSLSATDKCSEKSMLRMYDDPESGILYLNLRSHHNVEALTKMLSLLNAQKSQYEFDRILQSQDHCYLKSLLFLFLNCHHILLLQDSDRFNVHWLKMFKFLQRTKLKAIIPILDVMTPTFAHCIDSTHSTYSCSNDSRDPIMHFLSTNNLSPFIVPILTFLVPPPNTPGLIALSPSSNTNSSSHPDDSTHSDGTHHVQNGHNAPNSASSNALDDAMNSSNSSSNTMNAMNTVTPSTTFSNGMASTLHKAVTRKFTNRLQQQIVVLLRRCHAVFPYFEITSNALNGKALRNLSRDSLSRCMEALDALGFDTTTCSDAEIYSTHSRWIETDDMMHYNPLSLFSLLPNRFVQRLNPELIESLQFLFRPHDSIENDASLQRRQREDALHKLLSYIESTHNALRLHLSGQKLLCSVKQETFSDRIAKKQSPDRSASTVSAEARDHNQHNTLIDHDHNQHNNNNNNNNNNKSHHWKRDELEHCNLPQRVHFYAASKAIYDCLFKNISEIKCMEPKIMRNAMLRVHGVIAPHDVEDEDLRSSEDAKYGTEALPKMQDVFESERRSEKREGRSEMERAYDSLRVDLDTDRLGRYSSLCCRRATESARRVYLRDLPEMYTAGRHQEHIKNAMKIFRQQSVGPLQEYYCRKLFCEMDSIWKAGRQRCDAVSLTGRACSRPIHDGKAINHDAIKRNESAKLAEERHAKFGQDPSGHFSGFSSCHACNCGRTVSKREDPFDLHHANKYFFEKACCQRVAWSYLLYAFCPEEGRQRGLSQAIDGVDHEGNTNIGDKEDVHHHETVDKGGGKPNHYKAGFHLVNHGGAELYHKNTGISQPGFDRHNCWLQRWDIPVPSNVFTYYQHYKQKCSRYRELYYHHNPHHPHHSVHHHTKHKGHGPGQQHDENVGLWIAKIRHTISASKTGPHSKQKKKNTFLPCFVGLEFECFKGHRAILDFREIRDLERRAGTAYNSQFDGDGLLDDDQSGSGSGNDPLRFVATTFPRHDIPLRVPCKQCLHFRGGQSRDGGHNTSGSIVNSQLQRTFIVTPPSPITVEARPVIKAMATDAVFEVESPVVLPPSSFLVLRFPYIYFHDARGLPPDKLKLCKGMLTIQSDVAKRYQEQEHLSPSKASAAPRITTTNTVRTQTNTKGNAKWKTPAKRPTKKIVIKMKERDSAQKDGDKDKGDETLKKVEKGKE